MSPGVLAFLCIIGAYVCAGAAFWLAWKTPRRRDVPVAEPSVLHPLNGEFLVDHSTGRVWRKDRTHHDGCVDVKWVEVLDPKEVPW